jgi:hypothetical protein
VRAIFNTSVWLQAGQYLSLAAQIPAKQKSGCRPLRFAVVYGAGLPVLASHTELNQTNKSRFLRAGEAVGLAFQIDLSAKWPPFQNLTAFISAGCDLHRNRHAMRSNVVYRYRDLTPPCALVPPASCFISEMAYVIRSARHLTPIFPF